jgi:hypothetical protein
VSRNEKTRGVAACFLAKKLGAVYGFFGLVAGELAGLSVVVVVVAGFSVVVVAGFSVVTGFLFKAVMISVVKSMLSLECITTFTPFMLWPDLSKTMS